MKKNILAVLIALISSLTISMAQPQRHGKAQPRMATEQQIEMTTAKRVAALKVQLSLDEKQEKQITQIIYNFLSWQPERDIIPQDTTRGQRQKARAKSVERRAQMHTDIKGTLSDEQKKTYDRIQNEQQQLRPRSRR